MKRARLATRSLTAIGALLLAAGGFGGEVGAKETAAECVAMVGSVNPGQPPIPDFPECLVAYCKQNVDQNEAAADECCETLASLGSPAWEACAEAVSVQAATVSNACANGTANPRLYAGSGCTDD